jgi:hypothetical protein
MVPKLNPPSVKLVDAEAGGLISIAQGIAALDAGQWLLTLYEIDLTPQILREIAKFSKSGSAKSGISSWLRTDRTRRRHLRPNAQEIRAITSLPTILSSRKRPLSSWRGFRAVFCRKTGSSVTNQSTA